MIRLICSGPDQNVEALLKMRANINAINDLGQTPLYVATKYGKHEYKILSLNVNRWLICSGRNQNVEVLLKMGANVNIADKLGDTPLYITALFGNLRFNNIILFLSILIVYFSSNIKGKKKFSKFFWKAAPIQILIQRTMCLFFFWLFMKVKCLAISLIRHMYSKFSVNKMNILLWIQ